MEIRKQSEDVVAVLQFATAHLTVTVEDREQTKIDGATTSIDGMGIGTSDTLGNFITEVKTHGTYNISATKRGYIPGFAVKDLPFGTESATATVVLERVQDPTLLIIGTAAVILALAVAIGIRQIRGTKRGRGPRRGFY